MTIRDRNAETAGRPRTTGSALRRCATTTVIAAILCGPAAMSGRAQEPDNRPLGLWHRDDHTAVRIEADRVIRIAGEEHWVESAEQCTVVFEHAFGTATRAALLAAYDTPDFADPYGNPLGEALAALLPQRDEPFATLLSSCCCPTEIPGTSRYVLLDEHTVLEIAAGDGVFDLDLLHAMVPPPSHDDLSDDERREIQTALQDAGVYNGAVDGVFGPTTTAAIAAWQRSIGAEPTGVLARSQVIRLLFGPDATR